MFLSENYTNVSENVSADPMYGMQLIQEATESYNELCMKMIKLEHTAIVNEDAALLEAGVKDFGNKFTEWVKVTAKKFVEFLERVRVQWSNLTASISSKFLNRDVIEVMNRKLREGKFNVKLDSAKWADAKETVNMFANASTFVTVAEGMVGNDDVKASEKSIKEMLKMKIPACQKIFKWKEMPSDNETDVPVTKDLVNGALNFLKQRPTAVKNIQVFKSGVTKIANKLIASSKSGKTPKKNILVEFQSVCNEMIIAVNKATSMAIRICNAVYVKGASGTSEKAAKKTVKKEQPTIYTKNAAVSESVLDQFA